MNELCEKFPEKFAVLAFPTNQVSVVVEYANKNE